uniref:Uncharacterized protein n=1 Tax=Chromera velia CCMP2878 TaxID=1169474 RepID=A0A0G4IB83_9ALVE|eukprot:Cvel_2180.t1-p1 / transcript=Cvel_2180.t1 / gene=Cvel_2180 / organism=Chromera_velia_CCMP2878 / gene_product=hypothetical protein / transcript_product=hypothetical protein / location=Cvel_scaffold84:103618-105100(-) / protein_length=440 / sequence_SO=supercontig / SO=protein_coding / is_pseudo=false
MVATATAAFDFSKLDLDFDVKGLKFPDFGLGDKTDLGDKKDVRIKEKTCEGFTCTPMFRSIPRTPADEIFCSVKDGCTSTTCCVPSCSDEFDDTACADAGFSTLKDGADAIACNGESGCTPSLCCDQTCETFANNCTAPLFVPVEDAADRFCPSGGCTTDLCCTETVRILSEGPDNLPQCPSISPQWSVILRNLGGEEDPEDTASMARGNNQQPGGTAATQIIGLLPGQQGQLFQPTDNTLFPEGDVLNNVVNLTYSIDSTGGEYEQSLDIIGPAGSASFSETVGDIFEMSNTDFVCFRGDPEESDGCPPDGTQVRGPPLPDPLDNFDKFAAPLNADSTCQLLTTFASGGTQRSITYQSIIVAGQDVLAARGMGPYTVSTDGSAPVIDRLFFDFPAESAPFFDVDFTAADLSFLMEGEFVTNNDEFIWLSCGQCFPPEMS